MKINEYWTQFFPINKTWYIIMGASYGIIGAIGLVLNLLVLFYLLKYKIRFHSFENNLN